MTDTAIRFTALIDILGFKEIVGRNSHEYVLEKLTTLSDGIDHIKNTADKQEVKDGFHGAELLPYIFSDTLIIFTNNDSYDAAKLLLFACEYLFVTSLSSHLPIKGALSHGKVTIDTKKSIFFGQPIIDSHLLQEELKYYGMILHNTADSRFLEIEKSQTGLLPHLYRTKTPTKSGNIVYNNLRLRRLKNNKGSEMNILENLENLYNSVSGAPRIYVDNTIEMYNKMTK